MSDTIQNVQNRFKIGGVEYRLVTDGDPDSDPMCLVSVRALYELVSRIETLLDREVSDDVPTSANTSYLVSSRGIYTGLSKKANIDSAGQVSSTLGHNILYGFLTTKPTGSNYDGKTYYSTYDDKKLLYYVEGVKAYSRSPQKGVAYYNVADKTWYAWNGSTMVALSTLTTP